MESQKIKILFVFLFGILFFPAFSLADSLGQAQNFFIDPGYSLDDKEQVSAILQKISQNGYFYIENSWYQSLKDEEKKTVDQNLETLSQEFDKTIYPKLTLSYGKEWSPGIDGDYKITILFHQMKGDYMGYFNNADEYPKLQIPKSNEREMVYLSAPGLFSPNIKAYLAHEFVHLITFNQKDRLAGAAEEVWLNESRAEYAPTLLGYDNEYEGSNLQQRVRVFIQAPSDSLTGWQGQKNDYGIINIFTQYLVDHYGVDILSESLKSSKIGIPSINDFLKKKNYQYDFSQIFTDWTIAIYLNDCKFGERYCYKNANLKNLRISPSLIFFPSTYKTKFSLYYSISQWSGSWYRIVGGEGKLEVNFSGDTQAGFRVPYVLCYDSQTCQVGQFILDGSQKGKISFDNFGKEWKSLALIPFIQNKLEGFNGQDPFFGFSLDASLTASSQQNEKLTAELIARIAELRSQIAQIQLKINALLGNNKVCSKIEKNLYFGMTDDQGVRCLQDFLKSQGLSIYPAGLVTGNFGPLTQRAVILFQEKYAPEILIPLGLQRGTGFVGSATRAKINKLLGF